MLGEFRRAREHHEKHLELGSSKIGDVQDGKHSTEDINAICRKECIKGAAKEYVLDKMKKMAQISVGHDDQKGKTESADLTVPAKDSVHKVIQVASIPIALMCPRCYPFICCCKVHILVVSTWCFFLCACVLCWSAQEARSYNNQQYWVNRARVRLDKVNWDEGASRLTMDLVFRIRAQSLCHSYHMRSHLAVYKTS